LEILVINGDISPMIVIAITLPFYFRKTFLPI